MIHLDADTMWKAATLLGPVLGGLNRLRSNRQSKRLGDLERRHAKCESDAEAMRQLDAARVREIDALKELATSREASHLREISWRDRTIAELEAKVRDLTTDCRRMSAKLKAFIAGEQPPSQ